MLEVELWKKTYTISLLCAEFRGRRIVVGLYGKVCDSTMMSKADSRVQRTAKAETFMLLAIGLRARSSDIGC